MDIDILLPRVDADLQAAEAQLRAAQGRVDELRHLKDSLLYAVRTYGERNDAGRQMLADEAQGKDRVTSDIPSEWHLMSKMDAAERVLREIGRPAETKDIHQRLIATGRDDPYESLRSSLNYLKRQGRVRSVKPGLWDTPRKDSEGTVTAVPSETIPASGAGGDSGAAPQADRHLGQDHRFWNGDHDHGASVAEAIR